MRQATSHCTITKARSIFITLSKSDVGAVKSGLLGVVVSILGRLKAACREWRLRGRNQALKGSFPTDGKRCRAVTLRDG